ncbi:multicopper oxidase type 2 [Calothrix sp. NIES-2100]|uniref:multicopper oxidase domain-containing protein n=1 Tax=Calothrix sp. NIES-2100 TaxID=1954172 RepID=UPI000B5FA966|nr:multicopper oxidase type 2 [Calothrix sp. NIES-2100]
MPSILDNAYIIGKDNFQSWSQGYGTEGYLKVLPHPDIVIPYKDPYQDWQKGIPGNYFSSWGPEKELTATLKMEDLGQVEIPGLGILKSGDGKISWLNGKATPYEQLRGYNGTIPGPLLITEPGDTLNINLTNNLKNPAQVTNLHTHGLHVSAMGHGDNVLSVLESGETKPVDIKIPDNHFIGLDWYHPHLHGVTNEQVGSGLGGLLLVNPPNDLPDLQKWDVTKRPMYFMAINTFGIQQQLRTGKAGDPLNQDPNIPIPAGTPLQVLDKTGGQNVYELSDALYLGYNAKPVSYDPTQPLGNQQQFRSIYGGDKLGEPVENVIHTVNGQYNPTMELKTGEWDLFSFANMSINSPHILQLVKDDGDKLTPQKVILAGIDGDASGIVEDTRREVTELPILSPGSRLSIQHWFEEPGTYYFLSNGTEELLGDKAPTLIKGHKGFDDGHLIWGSQVLATIKVTGEKVPTGDFPQVYDTLTEQSQQIDELVQAANNGDYDRERTFIWSANLGNAILEGNYPDLTKVNSFEGTYQINGEYFSTTPGKSMVPLTMPMLGTTEIWDVVNASGVSNPNLGQADIPFTEWHPFHIHQNDFTVLEINGIPVKDIKQNYLEGVLSDTIMLPPTYDPAKPPTPENPYGTAKPNGVPSEIKMLMEFKDFPGSYVNHCHILFHEDAGMMAVVRVILNTKDTWLGLSANNNSQGYVELIRANNTQQSINLSAYGADFNKGIDVAIADVSYKQDFDNQNVTDNITDIITIQHSLENPGEQFTVKVFDGKTLIDQQEGGKKVFGGGDPNLLITKFNVFKDINVTPEQIASVASGDINGDGYADIVVGIGGGVKPLIEVYSGKDYQLISRLDPFHHEEFQGKINLAVGDANGDNFDDIIVGQGRGGKGLVEVYSGALIDGQIRKSQENPSQANPLDPRETSHETALLTKTFQPYGESYTGEVEVTSGYVLQRPDIPNDSPVQTNNANITTLAVDQVPDGHKQLKVYTYLGGGHGHQMDSGGDHMESNDAPEMRLEKEFTPDGNIKELAGTFADIPDHRGEPVLFARQQDGNYDLIHLKDKNEPEFLSVAATPPPPPSPAQPIFGNAGNDIFDAADPQGKFDGDHQVVFAGKGEDIVDATVGVGKNRIFGGRDGDELFASTGDRLFGGEGDDILDASLGGGKNRLYGGDGNDDFYLGSNDYLFGGDGNDRFFVVTGGNNKITGGKGIDQFWIADGDIPNAANIITDFGFGEDKIGIAGIGASSVNDLSFTQEGNDALISFDNQKLAILRGIQANALNTNNNFVFA